MGYSQAGIDIAEVQELLPVFNWSAVKEGQVPAFKAKAGTWVLLSNALYESGTVINTTTHNLDDMVGLGVFRVNYAGDYTIEIVGRTGGNHGIQHYLLNDVDTAQIDAYSAANIYGVHGSASLGTLPVGEYTLALKMASKNGASTGYLAQNESFRIYKTP